jgi:hypothetical protein
MRGKTPVCYVPALRFKQGEYRGLGKLAVDVTERMLPRFVLPPPKERDPEEGRTLTREETVRCTGRRIGQHWPVRPALLDPTFLLREFGEAESIDWLPQMFEGARQANGFAIPVATLENILGVSGEAFRRTLAKESDVRIAMRIQSGEFGRHLAARVAEATARLQVSSDFCAVLLDFADADLSDVDAVSHILVGALEDIQMVGRWRHIIFQGTNYPEKNPATANSSLTIPRNEWLAWKTTVQIDVNAAAQLIYGDYCADSAKFEFRSGGGPAPIRHYRYCTPKHWLVVRGQDDGTHEEAMRAVSQSVLKTSTFSGPDFSWADQQIYSTAKGHVGPGNSTTWREINTVHHITQVVSDIGQMVGFSVKRRAVAVPPTQASLFESEV